MKPSTCRSLFILVRLVPTLFLHAQDIDSLKNVLPQQEGRERVLTLNELTFAYGNRAPRQAVTYGLEAYTLIQDEPADSVYAATRQWLGSAYRGLGMLDSAEYYLSESLAINVELGEKRATAINQYNLSTVYIEQLRNEEALALLLEACSYFEENELRTYLNLVPALGTLYRRMGQDEQARTVMEKGLETARQQTDRDPIGEAFLLVNLAKVVSTAPFSDDSLGIIYNLEAAETFRTYGLANPLRATLNDLAATYVELDQFEPALPIYEESLQLAQQLGVTEGELYAHAGLGIAYLKEEKFTQARYHFEQALAFEGKVEDQVAFFDLYDFSSQVEAELNRNDKAYTLLRKAFDLQDTIYKRESLGALNELQVQYDTEKRERELAEQKLLTLEEQARNRRLQLGFGIGLSILLLGVGIWVIRNRFQQRLKMQKLVAEQQKKRFAAVIAAEEQERTRIARDLHDGLGQLLSTARMNVSSLDEAVESGGDSEDNTVLHTSLDLLDEATNEVRQVSHNLMPFTLRDTGWIPALRNMAATINTRTESPQVEIKAEAYIGRLAEEKEIALYRICQEILNNSLKHAQAQHIQVEIREVNHGLELLFTDDGLGLSQEDIAGSKGIGWKNVMARTELLEGTFELETPSKGSQIRLFFLDISYVLCQVDIFQ